MLVLSVVRGSLSLALAWLAWLVLAGLFSLAWLGLSWRWFGLLGIAVQRAVAHLILNARAGADLQVAPLEPTPFLADVVFQ